MPKRIVKIYEVNGAMYVTFYAEDADIVQQETYAIPARKEKLVDDIIAWVVDGRL